MRHLTVNLVTAQDLFSVSGEQVTGLDKTFPGEPSSSPLLIDAEYQAIAVLCSKAVHLLNQGQNSSGCVCKD